MEPRVVISPTDTRAWKNARTANGTDGWIDAQGVVWVRARQDEAPEVVVVFERTPSLPSLNLVRSDVSLSEKGAQTRARRAQRELTKRGLA